MITCLDRIEFVEFTHNYLIYYLNVLDINKKTMIQIMVINIYLIYIGLACSVHMKYLLTL